MTLLALVFASAGASARTDVGPKPHVGAIDVAAAICIEVRGLASAEGHQGNWDAATTGTSDVPDAARGGGKRNLLAPHPEAAGPHTSIKRGPDGRISGYETYKASDPRNPNPWTSEKRVDVIGAPHYNKVTGQDVPTPHVNGRDIPGGVRPAEPWEIPKQ